MLMLTNIYCFKVYPYLFINNIAYEAKNVKKLLVWPFLRLQA